MIRSVSFHEVVFFTKKLLDPVINMLVSFKSIAFSLNRRTWPSIRRMGIKAIITWVPPLLRQGHMVRSVPFHASSTKYCRTPREDKSTVLLVGSFPRWPGSSFLV